MARVPLRGTIGCMPDTPDCGRCAPLVRGYSLVYLFEAPQQDAYTHRIYSLKHALHYGITA